MAKKEIVKKKITFIIADDEMYNGLLEEVNSIRDELAEDIEGDVGFIEETEDEIIITLNSKGDER